MLLGINSEPSLKSDALAHKELEHRRRGGYVTELVTDNEDSVNNVVRGIGATKLDRFDSFVNLTFFNLSGFNDDCGRNRLFELVPFRGCSSKGSLYLCKSGIFIVSAVLCDQLQFFLQFHNLFFGGFSLALQIVVFALSHLVRGSSQVAKFRCHTIFPPEVKDVVPRYDNNCAYRYYIIN